MVASANFAQEPIDVAEVAIYAGKGVVLFDDVAYALQLLDIKYAALDESDIRGDLEQFDFLIVPGGYTREYMLALGEVGKEAHKYIRHFRCIEPFHLVQGK